MVTLGSAVTGATVNLADGSDRLVLANGTNTLTVSNTESVSGGTGSDTLTLTNVANTLTLSGIESVAGGTLADAITLTTAVTGGNYSLGAGADSLTLSGAAANSLTATDIETITGGTSNDSVVLGAALTAGSIDLWIVEADQGQSDLEARSAGQKILLRMGRADVTAELTPRRGLESVTLGGPV